MMIANSARMLAQAADTEGYQVLAIDCYGDCDTRFFAEEVSTIPNMALKNLLPAMASFLEHYSITGVVYGSGFENYPESLAYLCENNLVYGNKPSVFNRLQNKPEFISFLSTKNIPYPEVAFTAPDPTGHWLSKPMRSLGGSGIMRFYGNETIEPGAYWQRYQIGSVHSLLFLANGDRVQTIGFNRQWHTAINSQEEFVFAGIINHTYLSQCQKILVRDWVTVLVSEYRLSGLNSLDFIVSAEGMYVLEINPRPTAAMQLFDSSLLSRHFLACQGKLLQSAMLTRDYCAYQILFSKEKKVEIPEGFAWPGNVMDYPQGGSIINPGQPICSMIMHGNQPEAILADLKKQEQTLLQQLKG